MELGVHFRLTDAEAARVREAAGDDERLGAVLAELEADEEVWARACETDKAWDPIACALAPAGEADEWPARGVIGGARSLQQDDDAAWITHLDPGETAEVADYLAGLDDAAFAAAYAEMPEELRNPEFGPDEQGYALAMLAGLRPFFEAARREGQHVVFTVGF
ncbi:DUF1877 family protein [Agromyces mediolanus]|uniref:DUF1877 family protein n=1 Tax=Agromyces mediolanus TaxID=41986 RepID=UPI001669010F|nr:DUF1877 family protein [Agromyces mediolanus]